MVDALHELSDFTVVRHEESLYPKLSCLFSLTVFGNPWNPADDALRLAIDMMNDDQFPDSPEVAKRYGWDSRRMNPALACRFGKSRLGVFRIFLWMDCLGRYRSSGAPIRRAGCEGRT